MRSLLFIIFVFASSYGYSQIFPPIDSVERYGSGDEVFNLKIEMSFHGTAEFLMSRNGENYEILLNREEILYNTESEIPSKKVYSKTLSLLSSEAGKTLNLFKMALQYNTLDDTFGLDGSRWCLKTDRMFTETNACFWSPDWNSNERGLEGISILGQHLSKLFEIEVY